MMRVKEWIIILFIFIFQILFLLWYFLLIFNNKLNIIIFYYTIKFAKTKYIYFY